MSTVTVVLPTDTASIAASTLFGVMFNWGLWGCLTIQVYLYYISFPKDRWYTKLIVYWIYAIETTQTGLVSHDAYNYYAKFFGHLDELNKVQNEWLALPAFGTIVNCTVQLFYAYRIQVLSGSLALRIGICLIAVTQLGAGLAFAGQAFIIGNFSELATKAFVSASICLAGSALCDIVIAVCMVYFLSRKKSHVPQTRATVSSAMRLVIETGSLTAVMATVDLILFLACPNTNYFTCIALNIGKFYANSLLVLFNNRIRILNGRNWVPDSTYISYHGTSNGQSSAGTGAVITPLAFNPRVATQSFSGIQVEEEIWVRREDIELKGVNSDKAPHGL